MAEFEFKCPQCGQTIEADDSFCGQVAECPHCGKGIVVPKSESKNVQSQKLRPIRHNESPSPNVVAPAMSGLMTEFERMAEREAERRRKEEERRRREQRAGFLKSVAMLAAVAVVAYFGYRKWDNAQKMEQRRLLALQEEERVAREREEIHLKEERKNQERKEAEERMAREEERERERKEIAERSAREEERARERKRKEQEELLARQQAEQQRQQEIEAARKRYETVAETFRAASLDTWQSLSQNERLENSKGEHLYTFLVASPSKDEMFIDVKTLDGNPVDVTILDRRGESKRMDLPEFEKMRSEPRLMVLGGRAYLFASNSGAFYPAPKEFETFNPSAKDCGILYDAVRRLLADTSRVKYQVMFKMQGNSESIPISLIGFGESVSRETFVEKIQKRLAQQRSRKNAGRAKKRKRTVILTNTKVIRKRIDGVTEVPKVFVPSSNKHRYSWYGREYDNEVRKEEQARAKWQELYDEAVRQEEAENEELQNDSSISLERVKEMLDAGTVSYKVMPIQ